jgi:hypothetical protein
MDAAGAAVGADGALGVHTDAGGVIPGGNHPPPKHPQPGPGCGVVQAAGLLAGAGAVGAGASPGSGIPGGSHPPLKQIQSGPGCGVVHWPASADVSA